MGKRVLYIGGFELPDKNAAAQRVIANGKILRDLGYEVIYLSVDKESTANDCLLDTKMTFDGFTYYREEYPKSLFAWFQFLSGISNYKKLIDKFNPEIIIAYNFPALPLERLRKLSIKRGIKLIADCTEWYQPKGNILFRILKGLDTNFRMKVVQPKLDGLIVISDYLLNYYESKMANVLLLPPLVDKKDGKWQNNDNNCRENDKIQLIYAGSIGGGVKDRLDFVVKSLDTIKQKRNVDFNLRIIGVTKEQYIMTYGMEEELSSLGDSITFEGRVPHLKVIEFLKSSDFQIFLRENNLVNTAGFPTKFVESTSCGTPVITNYSSDIKRYLHHNVNGFVIDISSLESLIQSLEFPLAQTNQEVKILKNKIDSNVFDYRNFICSFQYFLDKLKV